MPIVVRHEPDPELMAQIGYYTGMGQQLQWQQEMALRERMQERQIQSQFLLQQLQNQNMMGRQMLGIEAGFEEQQRMFHQQEQMERLRREGQKELQQLAAEDREDWLRSKFMMERENMLLGQLQGDSRDYAKSLLSRVWEKEGDMYSMTQDLGYMLTPEQQSALERWENESSRIISSPTMLPMAKAQALYQLSAQVQPMFRAKMPSFDERAQKAVTTIDVGGREIVAVDEAAGVDISPSTDLPRHGGEYRPLTSLEVLSDPELAPRAWQLAEKAVAVAAKEEGLSPEESAKRAAMWLNTFFKTMAEMEAEQKKALKKPNQLPKNPKSGTEVTVEVPD